MKDYLNWKRGFQMNKKGKFSAEDMLEIIKIIIIAIIGFL